MTDRILIVEDERRLAHLVADYLAIAGYDTQILADGAAVADWVRANQPALILLDLMLLAATASTSAATSAPSARSPSS
jgi:two-component system response regulator BaeR